MLTSKIIKKSKQRLLFFGRNSSFHGLNRLFNPRINLFSRLFWLLAIIASIGGLYLMMKPVAELGVEINYTPDTVYLDWNTVFPAVTLCEEQNTKQTVRKFTSLYPELLGPLDYNHRRYVSDMLYVRNQCNKEQCAPCGTTIACDVPWREIIDRIHKTCEEMVSECSYNGVWFPCCQYFRSVDSEHGVCYSFNTLQHKQPLNLFSVNRSTGPGALHFHLLSDVVVSVHSYEDLSTNALDDKMKKVFHTYSENQAEWLVSVVEIENDSMLQAQHIDERGCRFLDEVPEGPLYTYPVYSHGACRLAYATEETFAHCGCIHPARDLSYEKHFCNYTGINCWNNFEEYRAKEGLDKLEVVKCLPSCVESELTSVYISKSWIPEKSDKIGVSVNIKMVSLPTLRYKRNLRRTHLDLVVSVGGIAGLFFSASILSFLEAFYLFLRPQKFENEK